METLFECHITIEGRQDWSAIVELADDMGWKPSKIDGDPLLGDKVFYYLTSYHTDLQVLKLRMHEMADRVGPGVIRKKIEQIIYDTKKGLF